MSKKSGNKKTPEKATIREWIGLSVLALGALLYVMDLTVLHLAIPTISEELKPTSSQLLWMIDIYGFMVAGFLVTMGTLGDRIGRRKLLMIGAAAFGLLSLLAAFSKTPEMLIASRALLGIAGATLGPSTLSLIFSMFKDPTERAKAVGVWISAFSAGSAIGPILGGILLEYFWWGSVFLLAVPVMVLLLILGPKVLPEYKDPNAGALDLLSVGMSLIAILASIFGLKIIAQDGISPIPLTAIIAGIFFGILWIKRQSSLNNPMIDINLFKIKAFSSSLTVNFLAVFVAIGYFLFIAQYLQLVLELSPLQAGIWSLPSAIAFVIGSNLAPRIVNKFTPPVVISSALIIAAIGLILLSFVGLNSLLIVVLSSVIISLGLAPVFGLTTELIVGSAPAEKAGAASGISETASELGGALGIAILGSIGVIIYRYGISNNLPANFPENIKDAANDTLGAAFIVSQNLPGNTGDQVLNAAKNSFIDGMQITSLICATVAIASAIICVKILKNVRRMS